MVVYGLLDSLEALFVFGDELLHGFASIVFLDAVHVGDDEFYFCVHLVCIDTVVDTVESSVFEGGDKFLVMVGTCFRGRFE